MEDNQKISHPNSYSAPSEILQST